MNARTKLNNIQVLRAFAATAVICFHAGVTFPHLHPFGSFGVDVFFVISGYIMARILDASSGSNSDLFLRHRVLRIVPPYWFFTFCLFAIAYVAPHLMETTKVMAGTRANGTELLKSLFFIPFLKRSGLIQPLLCPGWTLNFEMFFYVSLAIGLLVSKRYAAWIGTAIVLIFMLGNRPFARTSIVAKFYSDYIAIEFALGVVCYYICRSMPRWTSRRYCIVAVVVCFSCAVALIAMQSIWPDLELYRSVAFGVPSFFLVAFAVLLSQSRWDIKMSWIVLIGDASYVLYLIHPFCLLFVVGILGRHIPLLSNEAAWTTIVTIILSITTAVFVHLYCERPMVRFLYQYFGRSRSSQQCQNKIDVSHHPNATIEIVKDIVSG